MALETLVAGSAAVVKPLNDNFNYLDGRINTVSSAVSTNTTSIGTLQSSVSALQSAQVPVGTILFYGGTSAPTGWLICDNSAISRTTYAALFAKIGTTFGAGDGSTTFNLPNSQSRYPFSTTSVGTIVNEASTATGGQSANHTHEYHGYATTPYDPTWTSTGVSVDHTHTYTKGVYGLGLLMIIKY